jgi:hypothetical protein
MSDEVPQQQPDPVKQAAGRAGARARREKAAAVRAQAEALANPDLSSPEAVRAYLEAVLVGVVTGAVPSRAGAAAASVASRLLKAHELSITKELKELRAAREEWEKATRGATVLRRAR